MFILNTILQGKHPFFNIKIHIFVSFMNFLLINKQYVNYYRQLRTIVNHSLSTVTAVIYKMIRAVSSGIETAHHRILRVWFGLLPVCYIVDDHQNGNNSQYGKYDLDCRYR